MKKNLKIGFIGGGINSTIGQTHYLASQLDGKWQVVSGFFSRNVKDNLKTASMWNISKSRIYSNLETFIKSEKSKLDAVLVLAPTPVHFKILKRLFKEKIPIICEKPLVDDLKQIKKLKKNINKDNFIRVTYNYTGYPMLRALKDLIEKSELGKIKQLHLEMPQDAFSKVTSSHINPKTWRLKDGYIPNICNDLGAHLYNLAFFLVSKHPSKVMANFFNNSKYKKLIDNAYFWLKYKNNINASFWISKTSIGIRNGLKVRIFGQKGSAIWYQMRPEELKVFGLDGREVRLDRGHKNLVSSKKRYNRYKPGHPAGFIEAFGNLYFDLAEDFKSRKKNKYTFDFFDSERIAKFIDSSKKSNSTSKWVKI